MIRMYVQFFQFPILRSRFYLDIFFASLAIAWIFALIGALAAVIRVLRISPAEAMRPEAPAIYSAVLLERAGFIWHRLSFTWKVIVRNVCRYKFRSAVTVAGVAISTALLLIGYFSADSINYLIDHHFKEVQREDIRISLESERPKAALYDIKRFENVLSAEPLFEYPFTIKSGWRKKDILITGITQNAKMLNLVDIEDNSVDVGEEGSGIGLRSLRE